MAKKATKRTEAAKPTLEGLAAEVILLRKQIDVLHGRLTAGQRVLKRQRQRIRGIRAAIPTAAVSPSAAHTVHRHTFETENDVIEEVVTLLYDEAITSSPVAPDTDLDEIFAYLADAAASHPTWPDLRAIFLSDLAHHLGWSPGIFPDELGTAYHTARQIGHRAWIER